MTISITLNSHRNRQVCGMAVRSLRPRQIWPACRYPALVDLRAPFAPPSASRPRTAQASTGTNAGLFRHVVLQAGPSHGMRDRPLPRLGVRELQTCDLRHAIDLSVEGRAVHCGLQLQ
jgi:hypothetical protein